jgi:hypothetical protein
MRDFWLKPSFNRVDVYLVLPVLYALGEFVLRHMFR